MSLFERIGEDALRRVLEAFYERVFADPMIGYLFATSNKHRLIQKELELVARMLGAEGRYSGMPMREAHARHRILGGHFARRQKILDEVLEAHGVDPEVRAVWRAHNDALRPQVTGDEPTECND
jgi:truncated hemoglobin YjbI